MTITCRCGAVLHRIAVSEREWGWADENGSSTHQRHPFNAYERLNDLAATDKKHPQYARRIEEYSRLLVDVDFGGTFQMHQPVSQPPEPRADQPDHCGWPAYLAPHGWECRKCQVKLQPLALDNVPTL